MIHVNRILYLVIASIQVLSNNAVRNGSVPKQTFMGKVLSKPKFLRRASHFEQKHNTITMSATTSNIASYINPPKVIICGAGPAGLLTSILLHSIIGVESIVLEKASAEPDKWSSKSYSIICNERGQSALSRGNCLTSVMKISGTKKPNVYLMDGASGGMKTTTRQQSTPGIGLSRPLLVKCLETIVSNSCPGVTLRRGAGVSNVTYNNGSGNGNGNDNSHLVQVHLDDGTVLSATHVIGADGKWSKVRESFSSLKSQATMVTCPSFGVSLYIPPSDVPPEWKDDGVYVVKPPEECMFYIIVSLLPPAAGGGASLSMVCYDQTVEKYPWLEPPADLKSGEYGKGGWMDETSAIPIGILDSSSLNSKGEQSENTLSRNLEELFQEVIPAFHALLSKEVYNSARINRRVTWLKAEGSGEGKEVSYSTEDGLVALVGDAAHAMTASMVSSMERSIQSISS